jgi:hypothetical protein
MILAKEKPATDDDEKEWENPVDPERSTDERDKEQLLRQYKEAKRRKDNLSETDDKEDTQQKH